MSVRISAHDWVDGGNTPDDAVEIARAFKAAGADMIDVRRARSASAAAGLRPHVPDAVRRPIRNEVGIATMAVGAITEADHVNSIIAAGRADLCAIARPHLANPAWTLHEAAKIGHTSGVGADWPVQYLSGKSQLERNLERERQMAAQTRQACRRRNRPTSRRGCDDGTPCSRCRQPRSLEVARRSTTTTRRSKIWLRLLACTTRVETVIRQRLRSEFGTTLPRFDLMAQLDRHPDGLTHGRAVAPPDGHRRQRHRHHRPARSRRPGAARGRTRATGARTPVRADRRRAAASSKRMAAVHEALDRRTVRRLDAAPRNARCTRCSATLQATPRRASTRRRPQEPAQGGRMTPTDRLAPRRRQPAPTPPA